MIRVTVELWPYGFADYKKTLAVADIWNDGSGSSMRGNYKYVVHRRPKVGRPVATDKGRRGEIKNYPRQSYPVWVLLKRVLNEAFK